MFALRFDYYVSYVCFWLLACFVVYDAVRCFRLALFALLANGFVLFGVVVSALFVILGVLFYVWLFGYLIWVVIFVRVVLLAVSFSCLVGSGVFGAV